MLHQNKTTERFSRCYIKQPCTVFVKRLYKILTMLS